MILKLEQATRSIISSFTQVAITSPTNIARVSQPCSGTLYYIYLASPRPFIATLYFTHSSEQFNPRVRLFGLSATV